MKRLYICLLATMLTASGILFAETKGPIILRYGHMNTPDSVAGKQATLFAENVEKKTNGRIKVQVYPSSQLGNLKEMAEQVSTGTTAFHHNTMAGIGSLYEPFGALDTPYLYRDVNHLLKACSADSPVMKKLSSELVKAKGVKVIYTFYFGTRVLTCDREIKKPKDLAGLKIRAIPFPIYMAAVEGMGAVSTPVDIAELTTALATGTVNGQENPVDVIWSFKFYETQKYLMRTDHIMGAECVVMNDKVYNDLPKDLQKAIMDAAKETSIQATKLTQDLEAQEYKNVSDKGMKIIGPKEGLDIAAFRKQVKEFVNGKFGQKYGDLYKQIDAIK